MKVLNFIILIFAVIGSYFINILFLDKILDMFKIMSYLSHIINFVVISILIYTFIHNIIKIFILREKVYLKSIMNILIFCYTTLMLGILFGRAVTTNAENAFNFESFLPLWIHHLDNKLVLAYIVGNIIAFIPMGFFLVYLYGRIFGIINVFLAIFTIELAQGITHLGFFDIDDIVLNIAGGLFGVILYMILNNFINFKSYTINGAE